MYNELIKQKLKELLVLCVDKQLDFKLSIKFDEITIYKANNGMVEFFEYDYGLETENLNQLINKIKLYKP